MLAYIIFMNDEPKKVVLSDERKALEELDKISDAFYKSVEYVCSSRAKYNILCDWHLREVEVLT